MWRRDGGEMGRASWIFPQPWIGILRFKRSQPYNSREVPKSAKVWTLILMMREKVVLVQAHDARH